VSVPTPFDNRLANWLQDGPDAAPSDLFDEIVEAAGTLPQRRALPVGLPFPSWPIVAAAAVLLVVVASAVLPWTFLPGQTGASSSVGASPTAAPPGSAGTLPADSYLLTAAGVNGGPHLAVTVPRGWRPWCDALPCFALVSGSATDSVGIGYWVVASVFEDPCQPVSSRPFGPSVEDLATALASVSGTTATPPVAARLGGYPGQSLDLVVNADLACEPASFHLWSGPGNVRRFVQAPGQTLRLWILDVEGQRVLVQADWVPGASATKVAELLEVAASASFEP
jgi:hypothetical protein